MSKPNKRELELREQYKAETSKNALTSKGKQSKAYTQWKKEMSEIKEAVEEVKIDEEKIIKAKAEMERLDELKGRLESFKNSTIKLKEELPSEDEFVFKAEKVERLGKCVKILDTINKRFDNLIVVIDEWIETRIGLQLKNKQRRILGEEVKK